MHGSCEAEGSDVHSSLKMQVLYKQSFDGVLLGPSSSMTGFVPVSLFFAVAKKVLGRATALCGETRYATL